jgi:hypothetical protein
MTPGRDSWANGFHPVAIAWARGGDSRSTATPPMTAAPEALLTDLYLPIA